MRATTQEVGVPRSQIHTQVRDVRAGLLGVPASRAQHALARFRAVHQPAVQTALGQHTPAEQGRGATSDRPRKNSGYLVVQSQHRHRYSRGTVKRKLQLKRATSDKARENALLQIQGGRTNRMRGEGIYLRDGPIG